MLRMGGFLPQPGAAEAEATRKATTTSRSGRNTLVWRSQVDDSWCWGTGSLVDSCSFGASSFKLVGFKWRTRSCEKDTATLSCRRPFLSQQSTTIITIYHNQLGEIKKFGVENSWGCLSFSNFNSINAQWRHRNNAFTQGQGPPGVSTSFDVVMAALPLEPLLGAWTNWCLWWKYMEIGIIPYLQRSLRINDYTCLYMFILNDSINNGYMNPHQSHYGYTTSMYVCMYVYIYILCIFIIIYT